MAERQRVILDLCSGLGGASEAFLGRTGWSVVRIENNPALKDVPHTHILDVLNWTDWVDDLPHPEVIWASPPCLEFSRAFNAPAVVAERQGRDFEPSLEIVRACMDIIDFYKPKWHIIENVQGARDSFRPLLGRRHQRIGAFYLWGNFPRISMDYDFIHTKMNKDTWSDDPLRPNRRALVPLEISKALWDAITQQTQLSEWT